MKLERILKKYKRNRKSNTMLYLYAAYLSFIEILLFHNAVIMNERIEIGELTMNEKQNSTSMSSMIRPFGFNFYYCTFVIVFNYFFLFVIIFLQYLYSYHENFSKRELTLDKIIFMKSDDIICVTLSFGFFIFNLTDMRV